MTLERQSPQVKPLPCGGSPRCGKWRGKPLTLLRRYHCANGSSSWGTRGPHGVGIGGEPPDAR
ncbi:hypothetical protein [Nostoc sp. MG11]|uniref:hypothetical protein n=1 Tax=Nostoc sp. MG11 TaxID=2721166 RepID=UPI0018681AAA|nr:hypothetical protein [Nostoc sp. MG11]